MVGLFSRTVRSRPVSPMGLDCCTGGADGAPAVSAAVRTAHSSAAVPPSAPAACGPPAACAGAQAPAVSAAASAALITCFFIEPPLETPPDPRRPVSSLKYHTVFHSPTGWSVGSMIHYTALFFYCQPPQKFIHNFVSNSQIRAQKRQACKAPVFFWIIPECRRLGKE